MCVPIEEVLISLREAIGPEKRRRLRSMKPLPVAVPELLHKNSTWVYTYRVFTLNLLVSLSPSGKGFRPGINVKTEDCRRPKPADFM